jgi:cholesterol transport system auxiliary component
MKNEFIKTIAIISSALLFGAGCIQRQTIVKDSFLLDAQRTGPTVQKASGGILTVQPFSIAPAYSGKDLVEQVDYLQVDSDYYNEYFVSPSVMITSLTRNWLADSGIFETVLPPLSSINPEMSLEGHIKKLLADTKDRSDPKAILEIKFILIKHENRQRTIRLEKSYAVTEQIQDRSPQGYIAAENKCLEQILELLEKDLVENL